MMFASATATENNIDAVTEALTREIKAQLSDVSLDFGLIFLSPHFTLAATQIVRHIQENLEIDLLIGCTGEGIIGRAVEIEREPAISLLVGHLPSVTLNHFSLEPLDWDDVLQDKELFYQVLNLTATPKFCVLMADPFSVPMDKVLDAFNRYLPDTPLIGGMASGARSRGGNILIANQRLLTRGAVGVAFSGDVDVDVIVSQGCRPIGQPIYVTQAEQNVLYSLEDEVPLLRLQQMLDSVSLEDKQLLRTNGLFVGRAIDHSQEDLGRGDFLIRSLMGVDEQKGTISIGDYIQNGERIQLHVRDASTAVEDLEMMLSPQMFFGKPQGAMLFSCNGRGTRLYDHPNGDINTIQSVLGGVDLAGFFCAGEIGPIGGKSFLHGHTACMALFRTPDGVQLDEL